MADLKALGTGWVGETVAGEGEEEGEWGGFGRVQMSVIAMQ